MNVCLSACIFMACAAQPHMQFLCKITTNGAVLVVCFFLHTFCYLYFGICVFLPVCSFTGKNLSIVKKEEELNVSSSQNFTVPCHIAKQSSIKSVFQVTWFWQKWGETEPSPIFSVYRNCTLQYSVEKGGCLRYDHPLPNQFSLTVLKPGPEDSGMYFCAVEEWLPSLSHGWWKIAEEKSGNWTVNVYAEGKHILM